LRLGAELLGVFVDTDPTAAKETPDCFQVSGGVEKQWFLEQSIACPFGGDSKARRCA
jgi:hypothetical protein